MKKEEINEETLPLDYIDMKEEEASILEYLNEDKKSVNPKEKENRKMEKIKDLVGETKKFATSLYRLKDEDFINQKFFPIFSKFITRMAIIAGLTIGTGLTAGVGPALFVGVVSKVTDHYLKLNSEIKQRQRLKEYYTNKIQYLDDKIQNDASTPEERYKLNKMKSALQNNLKKVSVFK